MRLIIFLPLLIAFTIFGAKLLHRPSVRKLELLLWVIALLPLTPTLNKFFYLGGVFVTDGLVFGGVLALLCNRKYSLKLKKITFLVISFVLGILFLQLIIDLSFDRIHITTLARDLKVIIYFLFLIILSKIIRLKLKKHERIIPKLLKKNSLIALIAAIKCLIMYQLSASGILLQLSSVGDDPFYAREDMLLRYVDFALPLSLVLVASYLTVNKRLISGTYLTVNIISLLILSQLSGNRTFIIAGLLISAFAVCRFNKWLGFFISTLFTVILSILIYSYNDLFWRWQHLVSFDVVERLLAVRFSPFFNWIDQLANPYLSISFPNGIGIPFIVPWFEYRGLDPRFAFIDNFFLTLIYKYGLILLFIFAIFFLKWLLKSKKLLLSHIAITASIALLGMTMSLIYQSYFLPCAIVYIILYQQTCNKTN